jgi:hypothetical protein
MSVGNRRAGSAAAGAIVLGVGRHVRPTITPDDPEAVERSL